MRTLFDAACRERVLARVRSLTPDSRRRWGTMDVSRMVAHLSDQMRHTLGDVPCTPVPGRFLRLSLVRHAAIYWIEWPKGRVKGPPDAFLSKPTTWSADLAGLVILVERFGARDPAGDWPEHGLMGPMSGRDWGAFCHKHFDHHLRQFGA